MRWAWLVLFLLAGCSDRPEPNPLVEPSDTTVVALTSGFETTGCLGHRMLVESHPIDQVQAALPAGYEARATGPFASTGLMVHGCDSFTVGPKRFGPTRLAVSYVILQAANGNEVDGLDVYALEVFVDGEAKDPLIELLNRYEFNVAPATVEVTDNAVSIVGPTASYRADILAEVPPPILGYSAARFHTAAQPLGAFFDESHGSRTSHSARPALLYATAGKLSTMNPTEGSAPTPAIAEPAQGSLRYSFDRPAVG